jgi:subtilase family serine protease
MPVDRRHLHRFFSRPAMLCLALVLGFAASLLPSGAAAGDTGADLTVTEISLSPQNPALGETVTVTATVKNQGSAPCGASSLAGYADSSLLATVPVGPLNAGQTTTAAFTWHAGAGTHNIRAVADSAAVINETDETNNSSTFTLTTQAPDLTVQAITWTPANPSRGDNVVFSVVVKNAGNKRSQLTTVDFDIDGNSRGYQDVPAINAGATATLTYNWIAQSGEHSLEAVVDESNRVDEANESNNVLNVNYLTMPPDLTIPAITWSPANPSRDDVVTFTINVRNLGAGRSDQFHLGYYIDGTYQSTFVVGPMDAGASVNVTFTWKALPDAHDIRAVADYYQNLKETDESNNERTVTFSTLTPDLTVNNITWTPQDVAVGDQVTFTAVIGNLGSGRAVASRAVAYIDGSVAGRLDCPAIDAGKEANLTFQWQATAGEHVVNVVVDNDNALTENREDNNKLNKSVPIIPPDLLVSRITWSPESPSAGDKVTFTVVVDNQGSGRAANFYVAHYIDDVLLDSGFVGSVSHSASTNDTFTWPAETGRHTIKAVVDSNSNVPESNEDNNEFSVNFVPTMPDLDVTSLTWSPADIPAGAEIVFTVEVSNTGTLSAGPSRVAYYVDGQVAGYADIGWLAADEAATREFSWVAAGGPHVVKIVADASDQVFEIDDANNTRLVNLPPPDLIVQDIAWSTSEASAGDTVTFTATLKNRGNGPSGAAAVSFYVDGDHVATADLPEIEPDGVVTSTFAWVAEAGTHNINITADATDRITESDETNNGREAVYATLTPDLYFKDAGWLMEDPLIDDDVTFTITVGNQGTGAAAASRLEYSVDDGPALYLDVGGLAIGGTTEVSFTARLETGSHSVTANIDADGDIGELDETNNETTLDFSTNVPDLVVKAITWAPLDAAPGDSVKVTVKLENRGRDTAVRPRLTLSIDGTRVGDADVAALEVGSIASLDFDWTALGGLHEVSVLADAGGLVTEANETNNARSRTIEISGPSQGGATSAAGPTGGSSGNKGIMGDLWWIALLVAAFLGVSAFVIALKSFKRDH